MSVSTAPVIYVGGAVTKPGGYVLQAASSGISVLRALAMAEGLQSVAAPSRSLVLRRSTSNQTRQEIAVDVAKLMTGRGVNPLLEPNDILFVPEGRMKKSSHRMGEIAAQGANGVAIYGLGYRVAGIR